MSKGFKSPGKMTKRVPEMLAKLLEKMKLASSIGGQHWRLCGVARKGPQWGEILSKGPCIYYVSTCRGEGALCVEMGFTWTFSRNQDAKVKLKSELISIKF